MPNCLVLFCKSSVRSPGVRFHGLSEERYDKWIQAIGRSPMEKLSTRNTICSLHFAEEDYELKGKNRVLKKGAVPTLNLMRRIMVTIPGPQTKNGHHTVKHDVTQPTTNNESGFKDTNNSETVIIERLKANGNCLSVKDQTDFCRICLQRVTILKHICKLNNRFFSPYRSLKDMLEMCVPGMGTNLNDQDLICETCLVELGICYHFIMKCLNTEKKMKSLVISESMSTNHVFPVNDAKNSNNGTVFNTNKEVTKISTDSSDNRTALPVTTDESIDQSEIGYISEPSFLLKQTGGDSVKVTDEIVCKSSELLSLLTQTDHDYTNNTEASTNLDTFSTLTKIYRFNRIISTTNSSEVIMECVDKLQSGGVNVVHYPSANTSSEKLGNKKVFFLASTKRSYRCKVCSQAFCDPIKYKKHNLIHTTLSKLGIKRMDNHCVVCSKVFENAQLLYKHFTCEHKGYKPFKCNVCLNSYSDRKLLQSHACGSQANRLQCNRCNLKFNNRAEYSKHVKMHRNNLCEICGKTFTSPGYLKFHTQTHDENIHVCRLCDTKFQNKMFLHQHMKIHYHNRVKRYLCDQCPKSYDNKRRLEGHINSHMGIKNFSCEICKKRFASNTSLQHHVTVQHLGIKAHQCEICLRYFSKKAHLDLHTQRIHINKKLRENIRSGPTELECRVCGKRFKYRFYLKLHLNTHFRIRNFKCEICGLLFLHKSMLRKHSKTHSVEENKKFRCDLCYKKFATKEEVDLHFPIHKRLKKYKCAECGEQFGRMYLLENHRRVAHETSDIEDFDMNDIIVREVYPDEENPSVIDT